MTQRQTKAIDFEAVAARRACGFRTREIMEATGLSKSAAHARIHRYELGLIDLDALFLPRMEARANRESWKTVAGRTVEEVMAASGLTYSGAIRRMQLVERGVLPVEALLETRRASYRRRTDSARETIRQRSGKLGEWEGLGTRARNAALAGIPGGTPWERANL